MELANIMSFLTLLRRHLFLPTQRSDGAIEKIRTTNWTIRTRAWRMVQIASLFSSVRQVKFFVKFLARVPQKMYGQPHTFIVSLISTEVTE